MSQIFRSTISSGGLPADVPLEFTTDSGGPAVPVANNLNLLANDTTDNDDDGIRSVGSGSTVTIELTNRLQGTATSTNGSTENLITFGLGGSAAVYRFNFLITGRDTGTGDGVGYTLDSSARTDGASATLIATPFIDNDEDASLMASSMDFVVSGNNVILQFTGVAGQTISINAVGTYIKV